jgi:hypothetical protein
MISFAAYIGMRIGEAHSSIRKGNGFKKITSGITKEHVAGAHKRLDHHKIVMINSLEKNWEAIVLSGPENMYQIIQDIFVGIQFSTSLLYDYTLIHLILYFCYVKRWRWETIHPVQKKFD